MISELLSNLFSSLRQLSVPREFRISAAVWPAGIREELAGSLQDANRAALAEASANDAKTAAASAPIAAGLGGAASTEAELRERLRFLADVATGLWRIRRNMVDRSAGRLADAHPLEEMRKPFRWLVSTWDALQRNGLEIQDHSGDRYVAGQLIKAHFEAAPDLHEDTITDTIMPTVYFNGEVIQMGEVVVGTPDMA